MAPTRVICVGTGPVFNPYLILSDGSTSTAPTGAPNYPTISQGLKAALSAQPGQTPGGNPVLWWSNSGGQLRSVIRRAFQLWPGGPSVTEYTWALYSDSLFQPFSVQQAPKGQSLPGGGSGLSSSPRGLALIAAGARAVLAGNVINGGLSMLAGGFQGVGAAYDTLGAVIGDLADPTARRLDDALRGFGVSSDSASTPEYVLCLPGEALTGDPFNFSDNPVFSSSDSGSSAGAGSESAADTLKRIADTLDGLLSAWQQGISQPDPPGIPAECQPGGSLFDKLLTVFDRFSQFADVFAKATGIPEFLDSIGQLPDSINSMGKFVSDVLLPFSQKISDILGELLESDSDNTDSQSSIQFPTPAEFWAPYLNDVFTGFDSGSPHDFLTKKLSQVFPVAVSDIYGYEFFNR